jgi:hypothetical protein
MSVAASQVMVGVEESSDPTFGTGSASPSLRHALLGLDTAAVSSAWLVASSALSVNQSWRDITGGVAAVTVVSLLLLAVQHLYRARVCSIRIVEVVRLLRVSAGAALFSLISPSEPGVGVAIFGGALSFAFLVGTRGFYDSWLRAERARGRFTRLVAIVGQGREAERVIELLRHHPELGYRACGLVGDRETAEKNNLPWLGRPRHAVEEVVASGAGGVLLVSAGMPSDDLNWLMRELLEAGLHIQVSSGLWQVDQRRLRAAPLAHEPFFYLEPPALSTHQLRLKRVVDVSVAATIVVLTGGSSRCSSSAPWSSTPRPASPLFGATTAAAVRCSSSTTIPASPASGACCGRRVSTSCPSCSTFLVAR